jgi:hypothetical protein
MYFEELLILKKDECGLMDYNELLNLLPNTPEDVLSQFFYDHGRNCYFQEQYSHLEINKLKWREIELKADEIIKSSFYESYSNYIIEVSGRLNKFEKEDFFCIDIREKVVNNWKKEKTWLKSPIFLDAKLVAKSNKLHLVEGHTRFGILKGLLSKKIISKDSIHKVWFGEY